RATRRGRRRRSRRMLRRKSAMRLPKANSHYSNEIDLERRVLWQTRHLYGRARRLVIAEVLAVDRVEGLEVLQVGDEHVGLDDMPELGAGGAQHRDEIVQRASDVRGEVALDQLARRRVE